MIGYIFSAFLLGIIFTVVVINVWKQLMRKR